MPAVAKETQEGRRAAAHTLPAAAASLYLLLPALLFAAGWLQPVPAALAAVVLLAAWCLWVRDMSRGKRLLPELTRPWAVSALLSALLALAATALIGFHGCFPQHGDMMVRNAVYESLVREPWPLYSAGGDYFVYYLLFWLPPAALTKLCGFGGQTWLFLWTFAGLYFTIRLLSERFRAWAFPLLALFFASECMANNVNLSGENWVHFNFSFGLNQLCNSYNHAVPAALAAALLFTRTCPARHLPLLMALSALASPFAALALLPWVLTRLWPLLRCGKVTMPFFLNAAAALLWAAVAAAYLSGQAEQGSFAGFVWQDMPYWDEPMQSLPYRGGVLCMMLLCALLPLWMLVHPRFRRTCFFRCLVLLGVALPLLWVGRLHNEWLYKGSLVFAMGQVALWSLSLKTAVRRRRWGYVVCALLFFALSSEQCLRYLYGKGKHFAFTPQGMEQNLQGDWQGHLNHPDSYEYGNFFGVNRFPLLLKETR